MDLGTLGTPGHDPTNHPEPLPMTSTTNSIQTQNSNTWQGLTNQALANRNARWRAAPTQAEQRTALHDRAKERRRLRERCESINQPWVLT